MIEVDSKFFKFKINNEDYVSIGEYSRVIKNLGKELKKLLKAYDFQMIDKIHMYQDLFHIK